MTILVSEVSRDRSCLLGVPCPVDNVYRRVHNKYIPNCVFGGTRCVVSKIEPRSVVALILFRRYKRSDWRFSEKIKHLWYK